MAQKRKGTSACDGDIHVKLVDNIAYDPDRDVYSLEFNGFEKFNEFLNRINYLCWCAERNRK